MSLYIDASKVDGVLIDVWYDVVEGSFDLDSYEIAEHGRDVKDELGQRMEPYMLLSGGTIDGVPATGFQFLMKDGGEWYFGPLTAIRALRCSSNSER